MAASSYVRVEDVRAMLRLVGGLSELPPDPAARARYLIDEICRLLGAQCGMLAVLQPGAEPRAHKVLYGAEGGDLDDAGRRIYRDYVATTHSTDPLIGALDPSCPEPRTVARREFIGDASWYRSEFLHEVKFAVGVDDALYGFHPLEKDRHIGLGINRERNARPFGAREQMLLHLLNLELGWFFRSFAVAGLKPPGPGLSPQLKRVLDELLAGASEKQAARRLNLSPHTIHGYVKALYKRFEVSSRPELLSKLLKGRRRP